MNAATKIIRAISGEDWTEIEEAYSMYQSSLDDELIRALIEWDSAFQEVHNQGLLQAQHDLNVELTINMLDEVVIDGTAIINEEKLPSIKLEYSYGNLMWRFQGDNKQHLEELSPFLKGNCCKHCWMDFVSVDLDIAKPGNDVYFIVDRESQTISRGWYEFIEDRHDSVQYSNNFRSDLIACNLDEYKTKLKGALIVALLHLLSMRKGIALDTVVAYEKYSPCEDDIDGLKRWAVGEYPETRSNDWSVN